MNNPENMPVDIMDERKWLLEHKAATGLSWTDLGKRVSINSSTLSLFAANNYAGDNTRIAMEVFRYRQLLASQATLQIEAPEIPGYIETQTSKDIISRYRWAHRGRMVALAMGPGLGKTMTARHYQQLVPNVWLATMTPSTAGVNNMQIEMMAAMGERGARGTPQALSAQIRERIAKSGGLLIFDEAQHLSEKSIDEIRSWHDATNIGIVLQGNIDVIARLQGGTRKAAFAQIYSRISMRLERNLPLMADVDLLAETWKVIDEKMVEYLRAISQKPGGLRGMTMTLELASMLAASDGIGMTLDHLQSAWHHFAARPQL